MDSEATNHMYQTKEDFLDYQEARHEVHTANDMIIPALSIGTVLLKLELGAGQLNSILLTGVIYIPNLSMNLLSVAAIVKKGYIVHFESDGCQIYWPNDTLLALRHHVNDLIRLDTKQTLEQRCLLMTMRAPIEIWHC